MNSRASVAFELARQVAENSDFERAHVGCLITYKGTPVASGCNSHKTHPMQQKYNKYRQTNSDNKTFIPKRHAEINALSRIKDCDYDPKKLAIYVYRIKKIKKYGMARPCPSCMQAIKDAGIKTIYYTTEDGYAEEHLN